jgi:hypothetical protein
MGWSGDGSIARGEDRRDPIEPVTKPTYDRDFWEQLWSQTLSERLEHVAGRPANLHLTSEVEDLRPGRALDAGCGHDIAERIHWVEADLATWTPQPDHYDLVACLYVHVAGSVEEMVQRMAAAVAPGGTLLLVGHRPVDPATGAATAAAGQVQVSIDTTTAALDADRWAIVLADERPRAAASSGVDAVIRARRLA